MTVKIKDRRRPHTLVAVWVMNVGKKILEDECGLFPEYICYKETKSPYNIFFIKLAALAQMVVRLPLLQRVRGSILGGVVNLHLKIFNLGARRGGDVHFLIARLYITVLD